METMVGILAREYQQRKLRLAVEADGVNAGQAAGDMHQGGRLVIEAAGITGAVETRRDEGTDQWKADLPAMGMAGEHQVKALRSRPGKIVGSVREEDAK